MGIFILRMDKDEQLLRSHYYDFSLPEGFGTRRKLQQALKRKIAEAKVKKN